jgi:high-affinity Fe2+/Pb2+ permease
MIRAYAIALAAGAQVFTLGIGEAIVGKSDTSSALFAGAGWVLNLVVAEWVIRRRPRRRSS